jgi:hypothetical protein
MRRALFRKVAAYEVDTIDRFRAHVRDAAAAQQHSIQRRAEKLPAEARELLAEDLNELDVISDFADELAIVALYRVVEINRGRILVRKFPAAPSRMASYIDRLRTFLKQQGVVLDHIAHHRAVEELRLLNNAIKHDAGYVSAELASKYPRWKQGAKLAGLGAAYERLKGRVPTYILRFAQRIKL